MFLATITKTLKLAGCFSQSEGDTALLDHFKGSIKADRPDRARYAKFFDLDDVLAHVVEKYDEKPWHKLGTAKDDLATLRSVAIVNLKVSNLYRSADLCHLCTGSLLSEIQGTSNSRWEK